MSGNSVLSERSTNVVTFSILIDGEELSREYGVRSISVEKEANRISSAVITISDGNASKRDFEASASGLFVPGKEVEIKVGYHSEEESLFKGIITRHAIKAKIRRTSTLTVECRDKAARMTVGRKSAFYAELSDSELMEELIGSYGLSADVEATTLKHKKIVKYHANNWDFLLSRADVNGLLVFTDDGTIVAKAPDCSQKPVLTLTYGANIKEVELEMDAEHQMPGVRSLSWDYSKQELAEEEGEDPGVKSPGNLDSETLSEVFYTEPITLYHTGSLETEELKAWADAQMLKSRLAKIKGRIRITGFAGVKAGDMVTLEGFGDRFNGEAFVSGVAHQLFSSTWVTDLQLGLSPDWFSQQPNIMDRPAAGLLPGIHGLHIGKVVQIGEDEEAGGHRILVSLPYVLQEGGTAAKGVWARLSNVFAGSEHGIIFRPEIDDEVVLGFINDDPREAVILGSLYSADSPALLEASDDNFEKGIYTLGAMKLVFNDDLKSIQLETASGNTILLSEDEAGILVTDENGNEVTLTSDGISLDSPGDITIKATGDVSIEGVNVVLKAQASFTAEGGSGAELKSSASTVVKGSIVQIN